MRKVVILGATGSIGTSAFEIVAKNPELFEVVAIAANANEKSLNEYARRFNVPDDNVVLASQDGFQAVVNLARGFNKKGNSFSVDVVLNGITGSIGLEPTLACLEANIDLALANKESLIAGGSLVKNVIQELNNSKTHQNSGQQLTEHLGMLSKIIPVDSEHSAIWQCLYSSNDPKTPPKQVKKILLTASGGPFAAAKSQDDLKNITPEQALNHPTWKMGKVVTTNSATLMNKALELIEACYLFDVSPDDIEVVIQHQSIIHSMVEYTDGSIIAQLSTPDMKLPIALGLNTIPGNRPSRVNETTESINFNKLTQLTFQKHNSDIFPFIDMAKDALKTGPLYPTVMNAANERAVERFHQHEIKFLDIFSDVKQKIEIFEPKQFSNNPLNPTIEEIKLVENWARG